MEILIKNMVCHHCVSAVRKAIADVGLKSISVELGRATIADPVSPDKLRQLDLLLTSEGFERISDSDDAIVEKIKHAVIHHVREEDDINHNLSECVSRAIGVSYDTASRIFSAKEGRTIEKYYIAQKIERVKELMGYRELTLSEIAYATGYSSVSHLSRQFKSVTGMSPSDYLKASFPRKGINEV